MQCITGTFRVEWRAMLGSRAFARRATELKSGPRTPELKSGLRTPELQEVVTPACVSFDLIEISGPMPVRSFTWSSQQTWLSSTISCQLVGSP